MHCQHLTPSFDFSYATLLFKATEQLMNHYPDNIHNNNKTRCNFAIFDNFSEQAADIIERVRKLGDKKHLEIIRNTRGSDKDTLRALLDHQFQKKVKKEKEEDIKEFNREVLILASQNPNTNAWFDRAQHLRYWADQLSTVELAKVDSSIFTDLDYNGYTRRRTREQEIVHQKRLKLFVYKLAKIKPPVFSQTASEYINTRKQNPVTIKRSKETSEDRINKYFEKDILYPSVKKLVNTARGVGLVPKLPE
jgi:hypothetical protein